MNYQTKFFLECSNHIEGEYSKEALDDAKSAWEYIINYDVLTLDIIQKTHKILMEKLLSTAGKFRKIQVGVTTKNGGFNPAVHFDEIQKELQSLLEITPKTEKEIKEWHIKFEHIHPYEDGNGRIGRILMNYQRQKAGLPLLIVFVGEMETIPGNCDSMGQSLYYKWF